MRKAILTTTFAAGLAMLLSVTASAQSRTPVDISSLGPQVGDRVPDFNLPDQNGEMQSVDSIMGPNGIILLFHRSADW